MNKPFTMTSKVLSILLSLALLLSCTPLTALAADTTPKSITLGTTVLQGGQKSTVYFGKYKQTSDGQGGYNVDPILWRVLANADNQLFLLSDQNLDVFEYHKENEKVTWETSTMRSWLNGLAENKGNFFSAIDYADDNFLDTAFSADEQAVIVGTTDKVFLLSSAEAQNSSYGFTSNTKRKSTNTAYVAGGGKIGSDSVLGEGVADGWWLRTLGSNGNADYVGAYGSVITDGYVVASPDLAVRPAFYLDLSTVLFASAATGGKPDGFNATTAYSDTAYKLTLLDSSREAFTATLSGFSGNTATFAYSGAKTGDNEYISAIVKNGDTVTHYGRLGLAAASGTATVTLPDDFNATNGDVLYLFNEQYNGDCRTDYASALVEIEWGYTVTFDANGGTVSLATAVTQPDGKLTGLPTPLHQDYAFDGWYTAAEGGDKVDTDKVYTENTTLYARWTKAVASITDKDGNFLGNYATLPDAMTVATANIRSTVTMLDSDTLSSPVSIGDSQTVILDLAGHTITNSGNGHTFNILSNGSLTINDSSGNNSGRITAVMDVPITSVGMLTINGGTIEMLPSDSADAAVMANGGTVTVTGGVLSGTTFGLNIYNTTAYISGGNLDGVYSGLCVANGMATIWGRAVIDSGTEGSVIADLGGVINVNGGTITTADGEKTVCMYEDGKVTCIGGTFPNGIVAEGSNVNALLATGYAYYDENGTVLHPADTDKAITGAVKVDTYYPASATVNGTTTNYKTLQEAIDAVSTATAEDNAVVRLLDDLDLGEERILVTGGTFTLDLGGKTLSSGNGYGPLYIYNAPVTVKNGKIEGKTHSGISVDAYGKLTVEPGVAITGPAFGIAVYSLVELTVNGGSITGNTAISMSANTTLTINGGTIGDENSAYAVYAMGTTVIRGDATLTGSTADIFCTTGTSLDLTSYAKLAGLTVSNMIDTDPAVADIVKLPEGYGLFDESGNRVTHLVYLGDYTVGTITSLTQADVTVSAENTDYTGGEQKQPVTVTVGETTLTAGTDYDVEYAGDPTNAGTVTVTVTFKNRYSGTVTGSYQILKALPAIGTVSADVVTDTLDIAAVKLTYENTDIKGTLSVDDGQTLQWGENTIRYTFTPEDTANYQAVPGTVTVTVVRSILLGDVNLNGEVTAEDALLALQAATNKITLTAEQTTAADVDGEAGVTANDALQILQYTTKKITSF